MHVRSTGRNVPEGRCLERAPVGFILGLLVAAEIDHVSHPEAPFQIGIVNLGLDAGPHAIALTDETTGEDGKGANAVDGKPDTFWHTQWQDANPDCPHEIIIKLTPPALIKGFTYLPRQDDSEHGTIRDYEFYVSNDGTNFGQPVQKGSFENNKDKKTVTFEAEECQYIKLRALSEVNSEPWTSAAEIGVIPNY